MDEQYTQEKRAEETTQEAAFGKVYFEIVESSGYADKKLQREFGELVLSRRPLWNKVCEVMVIVSMVILMLVFLEMGMRPKEAFLGWFVQGLCIGFAIGCVVIAVWGVIFMWFVRPRLVGRKRLMKMQGVKGMLRFYENSFVVITEEKEESISYQDFPWQKLYLGACALYLELKLLPLFSVLQPQDFTVGSINDLPAFLWEKAGLPAKDIT